jgi:hypothetical protein
LACEGRSLCASPVFLCTWIFIAKTARYKQDLKVESSGAERLVVRHHKRRGPWVAAGRLVGRSSPEACEDVNEPKHLSEAGQEIGCRFPPEMPQPF